MRKYGKKALAVLMLVCALLAAPQAAGTVYAKSPSKVEKLADKRLKKLKAEKKSMKNLKKAFKWSASLRFRTTKTYKKKKTSKYGIYGFKNGYGDCNVAACTFYWMAKRLGYDGKCVFGYAMKSTGRLESHAWVMIKLKGKYYYFDPNFNHEFAGQTVKTRAGLKKLGKYCGFKVTYGTPGTLRYYNEKKKPME